VYPELFQVQHLTFQMRLLQFSNQIFAERIHTPKGVPGAAKEPENTKHEEKNIYENQNGVERNANLEGPLENKYHSSYCHDIYILKL